MTNFVRIISVARTYCLIIGIDILIHFIILKHISQGVAIGKCPKDKLFREYIGLELQVNIFLFSGAKICDSLTEAKSNCLIIVSIHGQCR